MNIVKCDGCGVEITKANDGGRAQYGHDARTGDVKPLSLDFCVPCFAGHMEKVAAFRVRQEAMTNG